VPLRDGAIRPRHAESLEGLDLVRHRFGEVR